MAQFATHNIRACIRLLNTSPTEHKQSFNVNDWGFVSWSIASIILVVLLYILRKSNDTDTTSNQPNATGNASDRSISSEEERKKKDILKLFQSKRIQQKITADHIKPKSCITSVATLSTEGCQTTLDDVDHGSSDDDGDLSFDEEEGQGIVVIILPFPPQKTLSTSNSDGTTELSVSNLCAICLEEYREGETIVWSLNENCKHAFHRDCMTCYLVQVKTEDTHPCPCCRQNFFFESSEDDCGKNSSINKRREE